MRSPDIFRSLPAVAMILFSAHGASAQSSSPASATRVALVFSGGHETDPRDRGRPVILIASALGVSPDVFREAFSHVHPAPAGSQPEPEQVRKNKQALMSALGPLGVTDDRLNEVSNYYRYNRSRGEMWRIKPATGYALLENGVVKGFVVTDGGSGYSSPPTVTAPGVNAPDAKAELSFGKDFATNGSVISVKAAP